MNSDTDRLQQALEKIIVFTAPFSFWFGCRFLGWGRLQNVQTIKLDAPIETVINTYGPPIESEPTEDYPGAITHTFHAGNFHKAVVNEVEGKARLITYWSNHASPIPDLKFMFDTYGEGIGWREVERGYWYWRQDDKVRLWCSVAPAIGVATSDYFEAKRIQQQLARSTAPIVFGENIEWTSNETIHEMQRRFIAGDTSALRDFGNRSDQIAVSPDGHHIFVVRDYFTHTYKGVFNTQNRCPKDGENSTRVIVWFKWTENETSTVWRTITLPHGAQVEFIRFNEGQCHLRIRQSSNGRALDFNGSVNSIATVAHLLPFHNFDDASLWAVLEEASNSGSTDSSD